MSTLLKGNFLNEDSITELEVMKKLKSHNVIAERVELYRDFIVNLTYNLYDTFLGEDYISSEEEIKGHFNWCFNKVVTEFEAEEISFRENGELYKYFFMYFLNQFYKAEKKPNISYFIRFWDTIFNVNLDNRTKKKKSLEVLLELYEIFDKSLASKVHCMLLTE